MAKKDKEQLDKLKGSKPASDPESREKQLVRLAVNLAERQLEDGTASPSVINHFLKIASSRETIEREILAEQKRLIEAKAKSLSANKDADDLARKAIEAISNYGPSKD